MVLVFHNTKLISIEKDELEPYFVWEERLFFIMSHIDKYDYKYLIKLSHYHANMKFFDASYSTNITRQLAQIKDEEIVDDKWFNKLYVSKKETHIIDKYNKFSYKMYVFRVLLDELLKSHSILKSNEVYKEGDREIYKLIRENVENMREAFIYHFDENPRFYGPDIPSFVNYISTLKSLPKKFVMMNLYREKNVPGLIQLLSSKMKKGDVVTIVDYDCLTMDSKKFISLSKYFNNGHLRLLPLRSMAEWKYLFEMSNFKSIKAVKSDYYFFEMRFVKE